MIELDGSYGEGGGQILRTALALSTLTKQPFTITNIRQGRKDSGLKAQHLHCIKALHQTGDHYAEGDVLGSSSLIFVPRDMKRHKIDIDIGTAGSITLLLQSLLIPMVFSGKRSSISITGGTDVKWSPPFDYLANVLLPHFNQYADINAHLKKRGYYPKGGGKIELKIRSKYGMDNLEEAPALDLTDRGQLMLIKGVSTASSNLQQAEVAERQAKSASLLLGKLGAPVDIRTEYSDAFSPGSVITLWAVFENQVVLGADALGERGVRAETVGMAAAKKLASEIDAGAPVDHPLGDQLLPLLALTNGKMQVPEVTLHCKSNIYAIENFLKKKFVIEKDLIKVQPA